MQKIIVTGGLGFIGSNLIKILLQKKLTQRLSLAQALILISSNFMIFLKALKLIFYSYSGGIFFPSLCQ